MRCIWFSEWATVQLWLLVPVTLPPLIEEAELALNRPLLSRDGLLAMRRHGPIELLRRVTELECSFLRHHRRHQRLNSIISRLAAKTRGGLPYQDTAVGTHGFVHSVNVESAVFKRNRQVLVLIE